MSNSAGLLLALVLAISIALGAGLTCYQCTNNNKDNLKCDHGTDVDQKYKLPCTEPNATMCRKIVTYVDFDVNDNLRTERILRKCGYIESKYDEQCYYRGGLGGRQFVCSCKEDSCNSASSIGVTLTVVTTAVVALVFTT